MDQIVSIRNFPDVFAEKETTSKIVGDKFRSPYPISFTKKREIQFVAQYGSIFRSMQVFTGMNPCGFLGANVIFVIFDVLFIEMFEIVHRYLLFRYPKYNYLFDYFKVAFFIRVFKEDLDSSGIFYLHSMLGLGTIYQSIHALGIFKRSHPKYTESA